MKINITKRNIQLFVLLAGMIFTIISIFHNNLWFDESYSTSLATHSFQEIWNIDIHDVHPVFYYDCLHVLYLIFGNQIIVYRLFSWICLVLVGLLGYFGIRKDYGEDVGIFFTFFVFFFPVNVVYAGEVRMYTLVMLLVTVGTFFAIRIAKGQNSFWNHVGLVIAFILAAYTHYYGLLAAAVVNLLLLTNCFIHFKKGGWKQIGIWMIDGILQIGAYLPWILVFLAQMGTVKDNFWITWTFPKSLLEMVFFQLSGNLGKEYYVPVVLVAIVETCLVVYILVNEVKKRSKPSIESIFTFGTYVGVIVIASVASNVMDRMIVYARYLLVCTPLLLWYFAINFAHKGKESINVIFCVCLSILSIFANVYLIHTNYAQNNKAPYEYINQRIQPEDVILVSNYNQDPNSFIAAAQYMDHQLYYWNECKWNEESIKAYHAYGDDIIVIDSLEEMKDFHGRIWVIYADDDGIQQATTHIYDSVCENFNVKKQTTQYFQTTYKSIEYTIGLIEV